MNKLALLNHRRCASTLALLKRLYYKNVCFRALRSFAFILFLGIALTMAQAVTAHADESQDELIKKARIDAHIGRELPKGLVFHDSTGAEVKLDDYLGKRPLLITPVYYGCPMLCSLILNGLARTLRALPLKAGKDFDILTYTINPDEPATLAAAKKENMIKSLSGKVSPEGWHFLVSDAATSVALSEALGFGYYKDPNSEEYAHSAAIMLASPKGIITHYFFGIEYSSRDLKFGIIESSGGKVGNILDQISLLCFHYDPRTGKYGLVIANALRIGGVLTLAALVFFIVSSIRQEKMASKS